MRAFEAWESRSFLNGRKSNSSETSLENVREDYHLGSPHEFGERHEGTDGQRFE